MTNSNDTLNFDQGDLRGEALAAFALYWEQAQLQNASPDFVNRLRKYLSLIQDWVPQILEPMPLKPSGFGVAVYSLFVRNFIAQLSEDIGRLESVAITSPKHAQGLIDTGVAGARKLSSLHRRIIGTSYALQDGGGQTLRSAAAAEFNQEMTTELLRAILPPEHFEAVCKLGVDAAKWHERGFGLGFGLHSHIDWLKDARTRVTESFRVGTKKRRASDTLFVNDLATLWRVAFGLKPTATINRDHNTTSPFCEFVGACWEVAGITRPPPSADTIHRMIKGK